jgi:pyruvate formate lyase activating enzyme
LVEIKGLEKLAPRDFPGHLSATIFTGGCNFRCPYCHNADLVLKPASLSTIPRDSFLEFLEARRDFLEAVCITGGEPLMHADVKDLLSAIKERELLVKLDTNGAYPGRLRELIGEGMVDVVAMDVKAPLDKYAAAVGMDVDTEAIRESIAILRESGRSHYFRTTVVPGLISDRAIGAIASLLAGVAEYRLQPFVTGHTLDPAYADLPSCSQEELIRLAGIAGEHIPHVIVEGT